MLKLINRVIHIENIGAININVPGLWGPPPYDTAELHVMKRLDQLNKTITFNLLLCCSLRIPQGFVSNDRLANAANTSIRSYVTVNRPAGHPTPPHKDRPRSHTGIYIYSLLHKDRPRSHTGIYIYSLLHKDRPRSHTGIYIYSLLHKDRPRSHTGIYIYIQSPP